MDVLFSLAGTVNDLAREIIRRSLVLFQLFFGQYRLHRGFSLQSESSEICKAEGMLVI